jgi:type VI secretion system protein VasG
VDTGARNIENILTRTMLPEMATECLGKMAANESINKIHVTVSDEGAFGYEIS